MVEVRKSEFRYALLLILLLAIGAVASWTVITYLAEFTPVAEEQVVKRLSVIVLAVNAGLLLLAGALGLWAVRSSTEAEVLHRMGRMLEAMDYLADGLAMFDRRGRLVAYNPVFRRMLGYQPEPREHFENLFPELSSNDSKRLFDKQPRELEKRRGPDSGGRFWRFRSHPGGASRLIVISDVTNERSEDLRARQRTLLHMLGRVAHGVAHDFNNILGAISGYIALLGMRTDERDRQKSISAIGEQAQRGARLAAHLLKLSRIGSGEEPSDCLGDDLKRAAELLQVTLSALWQVDVETPGEPLPEVPLSSVQIEQMILNCGLLGADALPAPGKVVISADWRPDIDFSGSAEAGYPVSIEVRTEARVDAPGQDLPGEIRGGGEEGVIESVLRALLEEIGGRLEIAANNCGGISCLIGLPGYLRQPEKEEAADIPPPWAAYLSRWRLLVAQAESRRDPALMAGLESFGTATVTAGDQVSALDAVNGQRQFDAVIIDRQLLGDEPGPLLTALLKLQPRAGVVVLGNTDVFPAGPPERVIVLPADTGRGRVLESLLRARAGIGN